VRVDWLRYKPEFTFLKSHLPLEWLMQFPNMPLNALDSLFSLSAEYGNQQVLKDLIGGRCRYLSTGPLTPEGEELRKFWLIRSFFFIKEDSNSIWEYLRCSSDMIFTLQNLIGSFAHDEATGWPELNAEQIFKILDAFVDDWPKVQLPSSWGSGDPKEETAYRFLKDIIWKIGRDNPDCSIPVIDRLLVDHRFSNHHDTALNLKARALRQLALRDFEAPSPHDIVKLLDENYIASVEDLRVLLLEELEHLQIWLKGYETDPLDTYYDDGSHVNENTARNRIVEQLQSRLNPLGISMSIERHMANSKRCDIAAEISIEGKQRLLVVEVKGQWHPQLYTAAYEQLYKRYSHHPNASQQGIYLVLWFGPDEKIANIKTHKISSSIELKEKIEEEMPDELVGRVDVFVLDVSRGT
jgi:hypothetical protein